MMKNPLRVGLISLGCPKTLVDSEVMLGLLKKEGYVLSDSVTEADVAIVNTCAFIQDAKMESIETILQVSELKKQGKLKTVIVAGCLAKRYREELVKGMPEVDGFVGVGQFHRISEVVEQSLRGERPYMVGGHSFLLSEETPRVRLTPGHTAYLKISEGCSNKCSFCIIPKIRGPHQSRPFESVLKEAEILLSEGVKEINLVGQDSTHYGMDVYKRLRLAELLRALAKIPGKFWLRLIYAFPAHLEFEVIEAIAQEPRICKYLDMPIQHIDDGMLQRMRRDISEQELRNLLDRIRAQAPEVAVRSTLIVGAPGETDEAYQKLVRFVEEYQFDRLGVFMYSQEEGTRAAEDPDQIPARIKRQRFEHLMKLQQRISQEKNEKLLGKTLEILLDEPGEGPDQFLGRTQADAPEVDGLMYVKLSGSHQAGDFVEARVTDTLEYDLVGEELAVSDGVTLK